MPSTYAHRIFGDLVSRRLSAGTGEIAAKNRELFSIGLHGPDILFYHRPLRYSRINQLGRNMHKEKGRRFFTDAREMIRESEDPDAALAYILGFICHFTLDSLCHPFVNDWERKSGVPHVEIEAEFDKMLMREEGKDPWTFDTAGHLCPGEENSRIIGELLGISPKDADIAVKDMKKYCHFFTTENTAVRGIVFFFLKVSGLSHGIRGMFLNKKDNPGCSESSETLREKLYSSVDTAVKLLENYAGFYRGEENLQEEFERTYG